jgi:hypothetical protein
VVAVKAYEATRREARVIWRKLNCLNPNLQETQRPVHRKTPETGAMLCVGVSVPPMQPPERGAISSEDIQGDEWDA